MFQRKQKLQLKKPQNKHLFENIELNLSSSSLKKMLKGLCSAWGCE